MKRVIIVIAALLVAPGLFAQNAPTPLATEKVAAADELGVKPLQPLLHRIDALERPGDLAAFLPEAQSSSSPYYFGRDWLFSAGSTQDFADATSVIAEIGAGGLGLPDRDYYLKDDEKSKDLLAKYRMSLTTPWLPS